MDAAHGSKSELGEFTLGTPALVCRWRLAVGTLPLENRHVRALSKRRVLGEHVPVELLGWVKQHIEWTLTPGAAPYPDGVLMLLVDADRHAAMTVGPYEELADTSLRALAERACEAQDEQAETNVAPEALWAVHDDYLVFGCDPAAHQSGANSLIAQLAATLGIRIVHDKGLPQRVKTGKATCAEAFLVSDEHGVVAASDATGPRARRFHDSYERLLERAREQQPKRPRR